MYKGTREFLKWTWPVVESLILATFIGLKYNSQLATIIVIFIFMIFVSFIYKHGYAVRILGWGVFGLLLGSTFYLLTNGLLFLLFIFVRFLLGMAIKKLAP